MAHTQASTNKQESEIPQKSDPQIAFLASPNRCVFFYISITMDRRNTLVESLDTHQGYRTRGEIAIAPDVIDMSET